MHMTIIGKWKNAACTLTRSVVCQIVSPSEPGHVCVDIDECTESDEEICDVNGGCDNFDGGYSCNCGEGYQGEGTPGQDLKL